MPFLYENVDQKFIAASYFAGFLIKKDCSTLEIGLFLLYPDSKLYRSSQKRDTSITPTVYNHFVSIFLYLSLARNASSSSCREVSAIESRSGNAVLADASDASVADADDPLDGVDTEAAAVATFA